MLRLVFGFLVVLVLVHPAHAVTLPDPAMDDTLVNAPDQKIVLAGGCFWGVEAVFEHMKGVTEAVSGYAGGPADKANYKAIGSGTTGHAEAVQITYNPSVVTLGQILKVFFAVVHDPTQLNKQGPDKGTQYRSAIFYGSPAQKKVAEAYISQLQVAKVFEEPIVTHVTALPAFYPAEAYHQNYAAINPNDPYIAYHDRPKVENLKKEFPQFYVEK